MKNIVKYIIIFVITVFILFFLLVITARIPQKVIEQNIKESTFNTKNDYTEIMHLITYKPYTYIHIYADAMLLNITYFIDESNPIQSVMEAKYSSIDGYKGITHNFEEIIDGNYHTDMQYMRYWHGSMSIIRPLLVFFNLNQIYIVNAIVLAISTIILIILLVKINIKELIVSYIIGLIMCAAVFVPFCLEYYWTFLIMTIVSIIAIIMNKKQKKLNILFMISGMITCYLDFLSTEIITLLIPMLFILVIKYKKENLTFKQGIKIFFKLSIFWVIGYVGMWIAKWILASIILKVNALDYVIDDMRLRIDGQGSYIDRAKNLRLEALARNIETLFPIEFLLDEKIMPVILSIIVIFEIIFIRKKEIKKLWFSGLLLIVGTMPYIRYLVLASHSFNHYYFTFRSQIISVMAIILGIIYSIDKDRISKLRLGVINVFNNINTMFK